MLLTEHGIEIHKKLLKLPFKSQVFFGLLCAERLRACCWAFAKEENWDISNYIEGCDFLFNHLTHNFDFEQLEIENRFTALETIVPYSDDFGDFLSTQAQSGLVALLDTFEFCRGKDLVTLLSVAGVVVEALDNYNGFVHYSLEGKIPSVVDYPLLDEELLWQFEVVNLLSQGGEEDVGIYSNLRILNRFHAIPIAV